MSTIEVRQSGAVAGLPSEAVVVRRPHFRLTGESLFFLISKRPSATLTAEEQSLWNALETEEPVGALREKFGDSADNAIRRLVALEAAEVLLPPPTGKRRRVMVIEPHMDDAALSVGGLMLQRRAECEFLIVTMATQSLATSYRGLEDRDFFDIKTVSDLRKAESEIVARQVWGRHIPVELIEATLRYNPQNWTVDWFRRHKHAVFASLLHAPVGDELEHWTAAMEKAIAELQPEEIWMPLGVGMHVDHQLTRHACLRILRAHPELVRECACRFYQDVPYAGDYREHTAALVETLRAAGAKLEEERVDITAEMSEKMRMLSVYASQWKTNVIQVRVEACARAAAASPDRYGELSYRVKAAPTEAVDMLATSAVKDSVYRVAREIGPWLERNRSAPSIGLVLRVPVGRWAEDMRFLLDYFPNAQFEAHMQAKFAGESEMFTSPRVSVRVGGNRWRWVLRDALPATIRPRPVLIISGRDKEEQGRWLARAGVFSDPIVAPTMSDLILAIRYVTNQDRRFQAVNV